MHMHTNAGHAWHSAPYPPPPPLHPTCVREKRSQENTALLEFELNSKMYNKKGCVESYRRVLSIRNLQCTSIQNKLQMFSQCFYT